VLKPALLTRRCGGTLNSSNASGTRDGIALAATIAGTGLEKSVLDVESLPVGPARVVRPWWGFATVEGGTSPFTA